MSKHPEDNRANRRREEDRDAFAPTMPYPTMAARMIQMESEHRRLLSVIEELRHELYNYTIHDSDLMALESVKQAIVFGKVLGSVGKWLLWTFKWAVVPAVSLYGAILGINAIRA